MPDELILRGAHTLTVCNACRYCEQFCPVFPAIEQRVAFAKVDLVYLANLCHNCGECLYACQYAPPHEFGINVPKTLAELRVRSYEDYCWPRFLGSAFRHNNLGTGLGLALGMTVVLLGSAMMANGEAFRRADPSGDFYGIVPHDVMVALFGGVFAFVAVALAIGVTRFWREIQSDAQAVPTASPATLLRALRDVLTLRHLHGSGLDCPSSEETRAPWRRWFHHCTVYGFGLAVASTSVAAVYHSVFGWQAPYGLASLPVLLGISGGVGMVVGPTGLLTLRVRRDPALGDPAQRGLDESFIALLLLTNITGLALLALRDQAVMGVLLIVHLGIVLALFLTLPYGKFVHGLYRTAALIKSARERAS